MVGLVGLAILVVAGTVQRSSSTPWGPDVRVAVATHDVDAGHPVAAALAWRPARLVPEAALTTVPDGIATRDLGAGQVVTSNAVGDDLHDLLEPDEVALALAQELPALPADAPLVILGMAFDGTGQALGHGRLLAHTDSWTWIAVARGDAPRIAAATHTGGVQLALVPR